MAKRHVVDGSNLATEGRSLPSLAQLDEAVRAYRSEQSPDDDIIVVVDASFSYRIDESERQILEEAEAADEIVSPPAGAVGRGDGFLLRIADRTGAVVLSNDSFQEFHGEYKWLFDEGRLMGGKPVPGVGWIFTPRTPVRGPKSRVAVRDAERARKKTAAKVVPEEPVAEAIAGATAEAIEPDAPRADAAKRGGRRRGTAATPEAVNDPLPFITFIAEHHLGSEVEGTVESFTSHGAFVQAGGARCYAPVVGLGDPPPRSAKEVLTRGDVRTFVVQALDPPRRGIELALPGLARVAGAPTEETVEAEIDIAGPSKRRRRGRAAAVDVDEVDGAEAPDAVPAKRAPRRRSAAAKSTAGGEAGAVLEADEPAAAKAPTRRGRGRKAAATIEAPEAPEAPEAGPASADAPTPAAEPAAETAATPRRSSRARKAAAPGPAPAETAGALAPTAAPTGDAPKKASTRRAAAWKVASDAAGTAVPPSTAGAEAMTSATKRSPTKQSAAKKSAATKAAPKKAPAKKAAPETVPAPGGIATETAATETAATETAATETAAPKKAARSRAATEKPAPTKAAPRKAAAKKAAKRAPSAAAGSEAGGEATGGPEARGPTTSPATSSGRKATAKAPGKKAAARRTAASAASLATAATDASPGDAPGGGDTGSPGILPKKAPARKRAAAKKAPGPSS